jgi:DTW domain-containing protein YfiP
MTFPRRGLPPGRCPRCAFPEPSCICARIPAIDVPVRFVILRHASELPRLTSSARWAALALTGAQVVDYAITREPLSDGALDVEGAWALFPSPHATPRSAAPPTRIIVPDGTWQQARRMMQRVPALQTLPRLSLPPAGPALRLRRPPLEGGMSTLEAIAAALDHLGHPDAARRLLDLNSLAVDEVWRLRGGAVEVA